MADIEALKSEALTLAGKAASFAAHLRSGGANDSRPDPADYAELAAMIRRLTEALPGDPANAGVGAADEIERLRTSVERLTGGINKALDMLQPDDGLSLYRTPKSHGMMREILTDTIRST